MLIICKNDFKLFASARLARERENFKVLMLENHKFCLKDPKFFGICEEILRILSSKITNFAQTSKQNFVFWSGLVWWSKITNLPKRSNKFLGFAKKFLNFDDRKSQILPKYPTKIWFLRGNFWVLMIENHKFCLKGPKKL